MNSKKKILKTNYLITNLSIYITTSFFSFPVFDKYFKAFVFYADFMLSDKVFQRILPLNDKELCTYVDVQLLVP